MSDFPAESFRLDGEPSSIKASAAKYATFGSDATNAASQIKSLDTSLFIGPEADTYRKGLKEDLPPHLETTGTAFSMVATALSTFASDLTALQERMSPLRSQAPALWAAVQHAQTAVDTAKSADKTHASNLAAAKAKLKPNETMPPDTYHSDTGSATSSLSSAQAAWNTCLGNAGKVKSDLQDAIDKCDHQIHIASGMRFHKNPSGWGALWSGFTGFVKDHVAGLAKLSGVLKTISAVAGVLSFVPGLDVIAAPVALVTGAAALAIDASIKVATGKGSWTSIIVDGALLALPGVGKLASKGVRALREARAGDGVVTFRPPPGATPEEVAQVQRYVQGSERARKAGYLSDTGRVSTKGALRRAASKAAKVERGRGADAGTPYSGHVGHVPDTTWTGKPEGYEWHDQTPKVNESLGGQAGKYPVGHKPTKFVFDPTPIGK